MAAAHTGGRMIQLLIPGLGPSPMQLAEKLIANAYGVVVDTRTLTREEAEAHRLTVPDALLTEGGVIGAEIAELVAALSSSANPEGKEAAAAALASLAVNADNKVAIAKAGAIEPLVALVRNGTDGQKSMAAGALKNLAYSHRDAVVQAGGGSFI